MPRYILKSLGSSIAQANQGANRAFEKNLLNLSALGIKWNSSLIKQIRTNDDFDAANDTGLGNVNRSMFAGDDLFTRQYENLAGNNKFIAFYDQTYQMRRDFLRKFALQGEIDYVLDTIADEVIVNDDMHYFAYPNTKQLRSILKPEHGKKIVDEINASYRRIYHMFHFNESNDAWHYVKKFLVDGFLAFEIIYSDKKSNKNVASDIIGFKELDPITLQPEIRVNSKGQEYKVWVINKGDKQNERELLDTNVIYISWAKTNFVSHFSYCERLIRSFNMLRTLENSRIIWNLQNAQKRIKIVVPIGTESDQVARTRLRQLEAYYKEDIVVDNMSGEITVNGQPKFSFAKTMVFPSKEGTTTEISEIGVEGHDMNSTETLKWFWQRFMIESKLPKDRFNMIFDGNEMSAIPDNNNMTREEYRFWLFINQIRDIYQEIVIKPTWLQFSLHNPEFAGNDVIKNSLGLDFVEENIFKLAKENAVLQISSQIIQTLSGLNGADGKPVFPMKYLCQKYLDINDDEWKLIDKMKKQEDEEAQNAGNQGGAGQQTGFGGGSEFGFGGGESGGFGGEEAGGGFEAGGEEPAPEAEISTEPEPAPEAAV
jgi:uncharacterized membrane protein YgcG